MASAASTRMLPDAAQRDVSGINTAPTGTGLLAKFTRSPSRKHRPRPSSESIDAGVSNALAKANRLRTTRPSTARTNTAPADVTLGLSFLGNAGPPSTFEQKGARQGGDAAPVHPQLSPDGDEKMYAVVNGVIAQAPVYKKPAKPQEIGLPSVPGVPGVPPPSGDGSSSINNPNSLYQHIHDTSNKRMATLDYMRKAHEGKTFWFNTIQFSKSDISRLPSYTPNRLARRATNYMLLGMSIPAVLDVFAGPHPSHSSSTNTTITQEYLRNLNALLIEFETFQQFHPPDGSTASSLSRARIPQMFKRSSTRPRKSSGAPVAEIGLPLQQTISAPSMPGGESSSSSHGHSQQSSIDGTGTYSNASFSTSASTLVQPNGAGPTSNAAAFSATQAFPAPAPFDAPNSTLIPNEGPYAYLLTPPLPFSPDFHTVFSTLCEILIDVYHRLLQLLANPNVMTAGISEMFVKVDSKIRKVMVGGVMREFEAASRDNAKRELVGVQKVVLSGLMGN